LSYKNWRKIIPDYNITDSLLRFCDIMFKLELTRELNLILPRQ